MSGTAKGPYDLSTSDYLAVLRNGNSLRTHKPQRIGIIGAGISGLVAGWLLRRAGHSVRIIEASKTVGGRIKTLREGFSGGMSAEAGAMRIFTGHKLTLHLAQEVFGLETDVFTNDCPNSLLHINNRLCTRAEYDANPALLDYSLERHENGHSASKLFDTVISNFIHSLPEFRNYQITDILKDSTQEDRDRRKFLIQKLDKYSLRTFLTEKAQFKGHKLSAAAAEMICTVMSLEMQMPVSLAELIHDHSSLYKGDTASSIVGGMDMLPKSFVGLGNGKGHKKVNMEVLYSTKVVRISSSPGRPRFRIHTENPVTRFEHFYDCDYVVIAIPFSALRHVEMPGLLSTEKRRAIRQLHYDNSCKIMIEFSNRFWERALPGNDEGTQPIVGGASVTDLPVRRILYPSFRKKDHGRGGILTSYTWGDDSLRWTALSRDDRVRLALRSMSIIHNRDEAKSVKLHEEVFVGGVSHSWAEDEFTSGAFATFEPYQLSDLFEHIWIPDGDIHFCGEHTSLKHGWIEGAIESGIRVAAEVALRLS